MKKAEKEKLKAAMIEDADKSIDDFLEHAEHAVGITIDKVNTSLSATWSISKKRQKEDGDDIDITLTTSMRERIPKAPIVHKLRIEGRQLLLP